MDERIKITLSVGEDTNRKIKEIGALTHRADSHVVDWLVGEAWEKLFPAVIGVSTETKEPCESVGVQE